MRSSGRATGWPGPRRAPFAGAVMAALGTFVVAAGSVTAQQPSPTGWAPSWSPAPPDASIEVIRDTFDSPGAWWQGSDDVGASSVADGIMFWTISQDRSSIWDAMDLPTPLQEARVEAVVRVYEGIGAGGPLCAGTNESERAIWAGVNGDGEWLVGRIADSRVQVIERGEVAGVLGENAWLGPLTQLLVTLECTVEPVGADHYTVWIEGVQVADVTDEPVGPFLRAGLVASADEGGVSVLFDDFAVFGGPEALGSPDASAAAAPSPSSVPAE